MFHILGQEAVVYPGMLFQVLYMYTQRNDVLLFMTHPSMHAWLCNTGYIMRNYRRVISSLKDAFPVR